MPPKQQTTNDINKLVTDLKTLCYANCEHNGEYHRGCILLLQSQTIFNNNLK